MKFQMLVEVTKVEVKQKDGVGRNGRPYCIREQLAWAHMGKEYPVAMSVMLNDNAQPYPPGKYAVDERAIQIDRYGQLSFGRVELHAVAAAAQRTA